MVDGQGDSVTYKVAIYKLPGAINHLYSIILSLLIIQVTGIGESKSCNWEVLRIRGGDEVRSMVGTGMGTNKKHRHN